MFVRAVKHATLPTIHNPRPIHHHSLTAHSPPHPPSAQDVAFEIGRFYYGIREYVALGTTHPTTTTPTPLPPQDHHTNSPLPPHLHHPPPSPPPLSLRYANALEYYTLSSDTIGQHHVTFHHMGLCYYTMGFPERVRYIKFYKTHVTSYVIYI